MDEEQNQLDSALNNSSETQNKQNQDLVIITHNNNINKQDLANTKFIKQIIQQELQIWRNHQQNVPEHLRNIKHNYMAQCLEVVLKRLTLINRRKVFIKKNVKKISLMLEEIDKKFITRELQMEKQEGLQEIEYRFCWSTLANRLWIEKYSQKFILIRVIIEQNMIELETNIQCMLAEQRQKQISQNHSPVFSEDSFNPLVYQKKQEEKKKYYLLQELLEEEQINKMRMRLQGIQDFEVKDRLIKHIEDNFVIDIMDMPWQQQQ